MGKRESIEVNNHYQTNIPHIFAVGDVIGFLALAHKHGSGKGKSDWICGTEGIQELKSIFPYGIYRGKILGSREGFLKISF
jgi:NAD(P) transhydrogenase